MATPLHTPKESFWREQLHRWLRSGLGVRAFCDLHQLSEPNFYIFRLPPSSARQKLLVHHRLSAISSFASAYPQERASVCRTDAG